MSTAVIVTSLGRFIARILLENASSDPKTQITYRLPRSLPWIINTDMPAAQSVGMEVQLTPDLQAKLARLASDQGRPAESLVVEAIERMVSYDDWFRREVGKG